MTTASMKQLPKYRKTRNGIDHTVYASAAKFVNSNKPHTFYIREETGYPITYESVVYLLLDIELNNASRQC